MFRSYSWARTARVEALQRAQYQENDYNRHEMFGFRSYNTLWLPDYPDYLGWISSLYIQGRRQPQAPIYRTFSGGLSRVIQAARMMRSAHRPCDPIRTRSSLEHVSDCSPQVCTLRQPNVWNKKVR
jgi:hypothetical protein